MERVFMKYGVRNPLPTMFLNPTLKCVDKSRLRQ